MTLVLQRGVQLPAADDGRHAGRQCRSSRLTLDGLDAEVHLQGRLACLVQPAPGAWLCAATRDGRIREPDNDDLARMKTINQHTKVLAGLASLASTWDRLI